MSRIARDIGWGVRQGLLFGVIFTAITLLSLALQGMPRLGPKQVSPGLLLLLFPLAGIYIGIVIGILRPLLRRRSGAVLAGSVAALPLQYLIIAMFRMPPTGLTVAHLFAGVISAVVVGGGAAYVLWGVLSSGPSSAPSSSEAEPPLSAPERLHRKTRNRKPRR